MRWTQELTELCRSLGVRYPIIQAPMAGGPGTPALVAGVAEAGGLGSIGAGYMTADDLEAELEAVRGLTAWPVSVNLFCNPPPTPGRLT